jgi:ribose transport system ATP-binding protein
VLELRNISKRFPGVEALRGVSLAFAAGEIHALVGENGAGKSTAIRVMTGIEQPDEGQVVLDGRALRLDGYGDALAAGIGIVPQELQLIPDASVAENIMIDKLLTRAPGIVDWPAMHAAARRQLDRIGLNVDTEQLVRRLPAAQKQMIQIARALAADVRILLLDEPTSSLTEHEARRLFEVLRELRAAGVALVLVSHKLDEVFAIADRVSVLRDGALVGTRSIADISPPQLVQMMIGRACNDDHLGVLSPDWNQPVLRVEDFCKPAKARNQSFVLHKGEILGFYGLVGAGRTELARMIIGEDRPDSGRMWVHGAESSIRSIGEAVDRYGIGYVTENRKEEGLFLDDSVRTNITVGIWKRLRHPLTRRIDPRQEDQVAQRYIDAMAVRTPSADQKLKNLSGGNQQKVSIAKWLATRCDILIIDEPTIGVDVGAKEQIHRLIWDLAARQGKSVILISSDLPEITRLANRILVFRDQRIVGEVRDIDAMAKTYPQVASEIAPYLQ